jgi:hypothetical protein
MTAKTCAIPGGPPGLFPTQQPGQLAGGLRQVTLTYFIAVPLAQMRDNILELAHPLSQQSSS